MRPIVLLVGVCAAVARKDTMKEPAPVLNPFFESLLKWWCETMENEADKRCNLLFTHRHISQTNDGTQIRGLSQQLRTFLPKTATEQRDQFKALTEEFCQTAEKHRGCKDTEVYMTPILRGGTALVLPQRAAQHADAAPVHTPAATIGANKLNLKVPLVAVADRPVGKSVTLADGSHEAAGEKKAAAGHSAGAGAPAHHISKPVAVAHEGHGKINGTAAAAAAEEKLGKGLADGLGAGFGGMFHPNDAMVAQAKELSNEPHKVVVKAPPPARTAAAHAGSASQSATAAHATAAHLLPASAAHALAHGTKHDLDKHKTAAEFDAAMKKAAITMAHASGGHAPMVAATKASEVPHIAAHNPRMREPGAKAPHDKAGLDLWASLGSKGAAHPHHETAPHHETPSAARHLHGVDHHPSEPLAVHPFAFGASLGSATNPALSTKRGLGGSHEDSTMMHDALVHACALGKNSASRAACAALPGIVAEYCATLSTLDARTTCLAGQKRLQALLATQPQESDEVLGPAVLGAVVLLLLVGLWALANRKKRPVHLPGCCMQMPCVYALVSHKHRQRKTDADLDAKDGV